MGKWTPDYMDDVLHAKVKSLVSGSIKRSFIEKTEPKISYEKFVEELDTGDSFTTSIIDLLVKELAERHARPAEDKHAIAERTGRALENLSRYRRYNPMSRSYYHRRVVNNADFLSFPPPNHMDLEDDEDEFESMLDDPVESANARNSDMYDTYIPRSTDSPSPGEENTPSSSSATPQPPARSPPPRSGPWSMASSFAPLVSTRPPRRAPRTRGSDFSNFTSQRRLASRTEGSEGTSETRETLNRHPQPVRRFFPFTRPRRHDIPPPSWVDVADAMGAQGDHDEPNPYEPIIPWYQYPLPSPHELPRVSYDVESVDDRPPPAAPRLRRGGIRAPESMMMRHRSPLFAPISPPPTLTPRSEPAEPPSSREAYPTPGPGESENSS